ncbi:Asp23/Gls24 family envelope stress response protein [Streptomyces sp. ISL-87]|nr:Asp23/Gls24 family envelope stress response protein [Streptomyces sp. ISL-21]MBT2455961.1 Asp23/Gls24 family envelope stress response protein [Streptomyces sp. ISL-86]MBT2611350.1 Asp23/Gls24 family envelope stress response protein [Streptomyces sp. ISL-87]
MPQGPAGATRALPPAAERGATVIPDKVVARIAARAAREALHRQAGTSHMNLAAPRASVAVAGGSARLGLTLDLPYPAELAGAARQLQHYVGERVAELTGMKVSEVTVTIEHLVPASGGERRRVQ